MIFLCGIMRPDNICLIKGVGFSSFQWKEVQVVSVILIGKNDLDVLKGKEVLSGFATDFRSLLRVSLRLLRYPPFVTISSFRRGDTQLSLCRYGVTGTGMAHVLSLSYRPNESRGTKKMSFSNWSFSVRHFENPYI